MCNEAVRATTNNHGPDGARNPLPETGSDIVPPPLPPQCQVEHDSIVHRGAPPVSGLAQAAVCAPRPPASDPSLDQLTIVQGRVRRQESTSWLSSIVLHAVLLAIIGLVLAPADYGGADAIKLIITFQDQEANDQIEVAPVVTTSVEPEAPETAVVAEPVIQPQPVAAAGSAGASQSVEQSKGDGIRGNASPRGTFFGIEAYGHEFVYVLDMSGSMEGRRYRRATDELKRSVNELTEAQNFYVVLFDDSAVQMFSETRASPKSIPATMENKERLFNWLDESFRGGGTDPRQALRTALRMNPSAIFMLSDGKFNGQKKQKATLTGGNSDAFSIVAAAQNGVPIHAIAFENENSCENMKRLADMTDGAYRFCKPLNENSAKATLAEAQQARSRGDLAESERMLRRVIEIYGDTQTAWAARSELATTLYDAAETALDSNDFGKVKKALFDIVSIDELAVTTGNQQSNIVDHLLQLSKGNDRDAAISHQILGQLVEEYPSSSAAIQVVGPVANRMLASALDLDAQGRPIQAAKQMDKVLTKFPQTPAAKQCRIEQARIVQKLLARAEQLRKTENDGASAKFLQHMSTEFTGTGLERTARDAVSDLGAEMLVKSRDATANRDRELKREAEQQLALGFSGDVLRSMKQQFARDERRARESLRNAIRLQNRQDFGAAKQLYDRILEEYPNALASRKAAARLRTLPGHENKDSLMQEIDLELLEMMSQ